MNELCNNILQLLIVSNALKTSRKVLGVDMPLADEALTFEQRIEQVIGECMVALEKLSRRGKKVHDGSLILHVKTSLEKCRLGLDEVD